jgi:hypothetical protein
VACAPEGPGDLLGRRRGVGEVLLDAVQQSERRRVDERRSGAALDQPKRRLPLLTRLLPVSACLGVDGVEGSEERAADLVVASA